MDKYYCWASDFSDRTGEGNLARLFIKKNYPNNNYQIYTFNNIKILNYKYFSPLIGLILCWYLFIKGKKVVYLNYLPLWNCLLFIFLPPKTIFGPITGGAYYKKEFLIRKFLFPLTYKISEFFLNLRNIKIYFSTELLKKYLTNSTIRKSSFNYVFNHYKKKKIQKKNIDFLIYYKKNKNKQTFFPNDLIKKFILLNFKIHIVGDYFENKLVINHGYLDNKKVNYLLSKTFYSITSDENIYSFFIIECINNNVKILTKIENMNKIKFYKDDFIFLNFKNYNLLNNKKKILPYSIK